MRFVRPVVWSIVVVATTWCVLDPLPEWIAGAHLSRLPLEQRFAVLGSVRGQCVQVALALTSLLAAGYTVRKFFVDRDAQRAQLDKNMTDRFNAAVDHLGSEDETVRAGGIRALHRIMTDSPRDHEWVVDTISGFVRHRTSTPTDATSEPTASERGRTDDVRAGILALRFRPERPERQPLNLARTQLSGLDLRGIRLTGANLVRARLDEAQLSDADLTQGQLAHVELRRAELVRATLDNADAHEADLRGANLSGATLTGAQLTETTLERADLSDADLTGAQLRRARLSEATLTRTVLRDADLAYADLRGVDLREVVGLTRDALRTAITDDDTQLPHASREGEASAPHAQHRA